MLLNIMLLSGGLAVCGLIGHWTLNPVRNSNPFGI
jgi:hypothetical protein